MPFREYRVTSPYGDRPNPFGGKNREFHAGIDLVKHHLFPIKAFTDGEVVFAGLGRTGTGLGNYGNVVMIKDKNGCGQLYAHLDSCSVKTGDSVKKGQVIGTQGATGQVTGSHLHYEIRRKTFPSYGWVQDREASTINPVSYLNDFYKEDAKTIDQLANEVIAGKWGSGVDRKKRLGSRYDEVQARVNEILLGKSKPKVKQLHLPASASSWRVYPTNKAPVKGNEKGFLNPKKFGGLVYDVIGEPQKDVVTIKTADFGTVNIYVAPSTGAVIK